MSGPTKESQWRVADWDRDLLVIHKDGHPVILHLCANGDIGLTRISGAHVLISTPRNVADQITKSRMVPT